MTTLDSRRVWMQWHRTKGCVTGLSIFIREPADWDIETTMDDAQTWLEALDKYSDEILTKVAS